MATKQLSYQRQAFTEEYCRNRHNAAKAYAKAYPKMKSGFKEGGCRLLTNDNIMKEIDRITAEMANKEEKKEKYSYELAIAEVDWLLDGLVKQVNAGNISAKSLYLQAVKEKAELTGLHKQRFIDETIIPTELSDLERARLRKQAHTAMTEVV